MILEECIKVDDDFSHSLNSARGKRQLYWQPTAGGVAFSGVCRRWRSVSRYSSNLYTHVNIPLITTTTRNRHIRLWLKLLKSWLSLSTGDRPLHIRYGSPHNDTLWMGPQLDSYQRGVYSIIVNHIHRVRSLDVDLNNFIPSQPSSRSGWGADELDVAKILGVPELPPYDKSQWAATCIKELRVTVNSDCSMDWNPIEVDWINSIKSLDTLWVDDELGDGRLRIPLGNANRVIFKQTTRRGESQRYNYPLAQCMSAVEAKLTLDMNYSPSSMRQDGMEGEILEALKHLVLVGNHYAFESLSSHLMPLLEGLTIKREAFKPHYQPIYDGTSKQPPEFYLQRLIQRSRCTLKKLVIIDENLTPTEVINCLNLPEVSGIMNIYFWLCKGTIYPDILVPGFEMWDNVDGVHVGKQSSYLVQASCRGI